MSRDGAEDFSRLSEFTDLYQAGARRFDMSEKSSFSNISGALAALQLLNEWGISNISRKLASTNERIAGVLNGHEFDTAVAADRAPHFQGARLPDIEPRKLAQKLIDNGVYASVRGDYLRIAPHLYTDDEDIARLDAVLKKSLG
jgi:selenocysteine lyase/cysteine desulfurase